MPLDVALDRSSFFVLNLRVAWKVQLEIRSRSRTIPRHLIGMVGHFINGLVNKFQLLMASMLLLVLDEWVPRLRLIFTSNI
jgi:hypothetical protein